MRVDRREPNQLRPITIEPDIISHAEGSCLIQQGGTRVLCAASVDEGTPRWMQDENRGWLTAEYGMLPRSTHTRIRRDKAMNSGRTQEISRLIARSLRAAVDLQRLPRLQITVDCDVIQADGGTRTAAITGGFVALGLAIQYLMQQKMISQQPLRHYVSAVSVGIKQEAALLDLNYDEDSSIDTDMNVVMTSHGHFIEIQGTAEGEAFSRTQLQQVLDLASQGCRSLCEQQQKILGDFFPLETPK